MSLIAGVRRAFLFVFVFGVLAPRALAAFAVCQAGWEWASNSKQQNPCEIAGALEAQCQGFSVYELGPLQTGTNYVTPQKNSTTQKCQCNTVMFSLYMACTDCQNVTTQPWTFWSQFCDEVYVTQYPETIPMNTAVPHWAFLDYTVGDKFDPATAESAGGLPETLAPVPSTISPSRSSTRSGSSSSSGSTNPTSTSTSSGGNNGGKKSPSKSGAIAGGVAGGLAFLGAVGVGIWFFLRRRAMARGGSDGDYPDYPRYSTGPAVSEHGMQPSQMRLYDPSDPSTFPSQGDYETSGGYTTPATKGQYSGVAEL